MLALFPSLASRMHLGFSSRFFWCFTIVEMHGPVNKNGIDQTNKSGQANRLFQGGNNYQITNCLRQAGLDTTLFRC